MTGAPERKEHPSADVPHAKPDPSRPVEGTASDVPQPDPLLADPHAGTATDERTSGSAGEGRDPQGGVARHPDNATAQDPALGDQTRAPQPPNVPASPAAARGTTHDPNSVTTGTSAEPTTDVFPPKGES